MCDLENNEDGTDEMSLKNTEVDNMEVLMHVF